MSEPGRRGEATAASYRLVGGVLAAGFGLAMLAWLIVANGYRSGFFVPPFYRLMREDLKAVAPQLASGLFGAVLAIGLPRRRFGVAFGWLADRPRRAAFATTALALGICLVAYQRQPLAMDEVAPLFQARVLAAGELAARFRVELLPRLFGPGFLGVFYFFDPTDGRIISAYWPGMALLLALFEAWGASFLLNPLLAGVSVWLVRYVAMVLSVGDREVAGLAMALLMCAPAFVINASSFYSMNAHLTANLGFVALLLAPTPARLAAAGAVGGLALALSNPLPHLLFALPWWLIVGRGSGGVRRLLALGAGYVPVGLLLVVGWFLFAESLRGPAAPPVGGTALGVPGFALLKVRAEGVAKLVLWAPFGLLPLAALGAVRHARQRHVQALAWSAGAVLLAYFAVRFDQGHGWGYRYFHPAFACLPLLGALSIAGGHAPTSLRELLLRACAGWCVAAACLLLPGRVLEVARIVTAHRAQLLPPPPGLDCVHFVAAGGVSSADLIANHPELRGELFLFNAGEDDVEAFRAQYLPKTRLFAQSSTDRLYCGELESFRQLALGRTREP